MTWCSRRSDAFPRSSGSIRCRPSRSVTHTRNVSRVSGPSCLRRGLLRSHPAPHGSAGRRSQDVVPDRRIADSHAPDRSESGAGGGCIHRVGWAMAVCAGAFRWVRRSRAARLPTDPREATEFGPSLTRSTSPMPQSTCAPKPATTRRSCCCPATRTAPRGSPRCSTAGWRRRARSTSTARCSATRARTRASRSASRRAAWARRRSRSSWRSC